MPYNRNPLRGLTPEERLLPQARPLLQERLKQFHHNFVASRGPDAMLQLYAQALGTWIEHPSTDVVHGERLFDHIALCAPEADRED